jgi:ATP-binding cassette subfamily B protein
VVKALQEGLGAIRDVLLDNTQPHYCDIYRRTDYPLRMAVANNIFIGGSPRFLMEALGITMIAVLAYFLSRDAGATSILPALGALALGAQRILPAMQQSYLAWVNIASSQISLADTLDLLDQPLTATASLPLPAPMPFENLIKFDAVSYRYSSEGPQVLDTLNLSIGKGARIGLVGSTGSGKSTLLDLLMGLIEPTHGEITVDGRPVSAGLLRAWQRNIAHVPQSIYLADTSFAENIAFGVRYEKIDMARVREAARQARIAEFIESRAQGYDQLVGERGIRISGGERQRIGIARALYKQATVLVFDEATSALDNETEKEVMAAIEGLNRNLTIVLVAHRLTTVTRCDMIFELNNGKLVGQGSYNELLNSSPSFLAMASS